MPVPPPLPDPSHLETRLLMWAEMLEKAVTEVRRVTAEMKGRSPETPDHSGSPDADV
jgi:hypothetical protein